MEAHFYNYITVAAMLILYGALFFVVENRRAAPHVSRLEQITYRDAIIIGLWQCLAIIPGTSRSGATIVGGLLLGLSRALSLIHIFSAGVPTSRNVYRGCCWKTPSVFASQIHLP